MKKVVARGVSCVRKRKVDRCEQIISGVGCGNSGGKSIPSVLASCAGRKNDHTVADCLKNGLNIRGCLAPSVLSHQITVGVASAKVAAEYGRLRVEDGNEHRGGDSEECENFFHGWFSGLGVVGWKD
jgi:hypothetical protein